MVQWHTQGRRNRGSGGGAIAPPKWKTTVNIIAIIICTFYVSSLCILFDWFCPPKLNCPEPPLILYVRNIYRYLQVKTPDGNLIAKAIDVDLSQFRSALLMTMEHDREANVECSSDRDCTFFNCLRLLGECSKPGPTHIDWRLYNELKDLLTNSIQQFT
jgi:hypothetical protein